MLAITREAFLAIANVYYVQQSVALYFLEASVSVDFMWLKYDCNTTLLLELLFTLTEVTQAL